MSNLNQDRIAAIFKSTYDKASDPPIVYALRDRLYRVRTVTVTFAEMDTPCGGWATLPNPLCGQLLDAISTGDAVRVTGAEEGAQ